LWVGQQQRSVSASLRSKRNEWRRHRQRNLNVPVPGHCSEICLGMAQQKVFTANTRMNAHDAFHIFF